MDIHVIPAIIPEDFNDLSAHLARISDGRTREALGIPTRVQVDIMDGMFAPTKSWPFVRNKGEFDAILEEETGLPFWELFDFEIDMMVEKPEQYIGEWISAGASSLIIHAASTSLHSSIRETLDQFDVEMGIAFRPSDEIDTSLIEMTDFVQIMGNDKIGYHDVDLDPHVFEIVRAIRESYPEKDISVDIGVDADTAPDLIEAGVNKLVSGSYIFDSMVMEEAIRELRQEI